MDIQDVITMADLWEEATSDIGMYLEDGYYTLDEWHQLHEDSSDAMRELLIMCEEFGITI